MGDNNRSSELQLIQMVFDQMEKAHQPIRDRLSSIERRLGEGDERMEAHSDFIEEAKPILAHAKAQMDSGTIIKAKDKGKSKFPWWVTALICGGLGLFGEKLATGIIRLLQDPPPAVASANTKTPP